MKSKIEKVNGSNVIVADGKVIDALSFKSFRPTKHNVEDFYKAGIRLFNVNVSGLMSALDVPYSLYGEVWTGPGQYDFSAFDNQIKLFQEKAPDAYLFINIHLDSREWWHKQNPGRPSSFTHLSQIASDEKWRCDTGEYLKALIKYAEEKYNDKILGYFLLGGNTTEWFSDFDHEESHPIKLKDYRKYMKDEDIEIPSKQQLEKPRSQLFLDPATDKEVIKYRKYHNHLISDTVLYYAEQAQKVLNHTKLVGAFFGYIMELSGKRLWEAGHLDIDRVYKNPNIDFFATPSSYEFRKHTDAGAYMLMTDTIELDGKMYFISFDHKTFKYPTLPEEPRRLTPKEDILTVFAKYAKPKDDSQKPGESGDMRKEWLQCLETKEKTIDVMRREWMQSISKRTGHWWFDMLEGWFYDDALMDEVGKLIELNKFATKKDRASVSEIAVIVSSDSMYYVNKNSFINDELITHQRDALARIGAPYDCYSLNDIERINVDQYKLFIFLNAFYLTDSQRAFINNNIKKNNRSLLFVAACDCIDDNGLLQKRMAEMLEMNIEQLTEKENKACAYETTFGYEQSVEPIWAVADKEALSLGTYENSKKTALAKKQMADHCIYFCGIGNISYQTFKEIAKESNVHIYTDDNSAVFANRSFVGVYNAENQYTNITLKENGEYTELFSGTKYTVTDGKLSLPTKDCPAQMLMLNKK